MEPARLCGWLGGNVFGQTCGHAITSIGLVSNGSHPIATRCGLVIQKTKNASNFRCTRAVLILPVVVETTIERARGRIAKLAHA